MEHIDSFEGKLFYKIYMLSKGNQINECQKGRLKDLVIMKDERLGMAMTQYLEDKDEWRLLENLHNYSCEDCSPKSYNNLSDDNLSIGNSSKYKGKRPAKMKLPLKTFMINLRKNTDDSIQVLPDQGVVAIMAISMRGLSNRTGVNVNDQKIFNMLSRYNINGRTIQEEKLLSEGGYGYILKAIDVNTREIFALKKSYCQGEERMQVAKNELEIMRRLPRHPNLVNFFGGTFVQEKGQQVCLILIEFCGGGSLFDLMAKDPNSRFQEDQLLGYMKEIAQGIKSLHTLQPPMAHRDIKIENVLFQNGKCKLCDFGSASTQKVDLAQYFKPMGRQIRQADFVTYEEEWEKNTTLMYRPPEMADLFLRYDVAEKVDVWMLGCVLYTLCFFVHPFQESSKLAISTATYTIPKGHRYSDKLLDLIRLMLTPNPKLRPSIFDIEKILAQFHQLPYIQLNAQAIEIKNRENKLEQEMEQYNKNSYKVKKFEGDIPIEELMNLQKKIQTEKVQGKPLQQQQQQPRQPQFVQKQYPQQQQRQQPVLQQQQAQQPKSEQNIFEQFSNFQATDNKSSNNVWDPNTQWGQQPSQQPQFNNFGFVQNSQSPSPNPFAWETAAIQPLPQPVQQVQIASFPTSTHSGIWDMTTNFTDQSQNSTQPSTNLWGGSAQQFGQWQSQQLPQQQQQPQQAQTETIDLIGLDDVQQPQQIDLSNIIL